MYLPKDIPIKINGGIETSLHNAQPHPKRPKIMKYSGQLKNCYFFLHWCREGWQGAHVKPG